MPSYTVTKVWTTDHGESRLTIEMHTHAQPSVATLAMLEAIDELVQRSGEFTARASEVNRRRTNEEGLAHARGALRGYGVER